MNLLALDTATEACSAALWRDGAISERFEVIGRGHAERLLPMADELLREAGIAPRDLGAIAFGRGPGSFTGLRIAAGVAQGLAAGGARRVVPVSDLAAVAMQAARARGAQRVLACMDARMGEVYWAAYDCAGAVPALLGDERLTSPDSVTVSGAAEWLGAGHGFARYPEIAGRLASRLAGVDGAVLPRAADIARIGAEEAVAGRVLDASRALPIYLRNEVVHRR
jgi:tRNA threonylcarbamoyladenosine biosynthesis protein TsaB